MPRDGSHTVSIGLVTALSVSVTACSQSSDAGRTPSFSGSSTGGTSSGTGGSPTGGTSSGTGGSSSVAGAGGSSADSGASDAGGNGTFSNDTFLPWAGGAAYYGKWSHGPSADPSFFPIAVWLQTPSNAPRYKNVGVNLFVGLWQGPTDTQLSDLSAASMPTFCDQGGVWNAHLTDSTIWGWLQPDEPDNAQANSTGGYDPCIDPSIIIAGYDAMVRNDPTRPVWLGLGRGVSATDWVGRGTCTGRTDMYPEYAKGGDILSFDIYPVNDGIGLEAVPLGVDNLRGWSGYSKPVVSDIEASNINDTTRPSPAQIRSEIWMALVHGAAGIQYFCHRFSPTFSETDCLDDPPTAAAMTDIDAQITALAPVLNTPSVANGVAVSSSALDQPVDVMLKRSAGATYLFATQMRGGTTTATFTLRDFPASATANVLGEGRTIAVVGGVFQDDFASYGAHLYEITF